MGKWYHVVPKKQGCYAIYKFNIETHKKELLYIGTSINLKLRLNRGKHEVIRVLKVLLKCPEIVSIKVREITSKEGRFYLEKKLIERLKPKVNYA